METFLLQLIFALSALCLLHSYLIYPIWLRLKAPGLPEHKLRYTEEETWPAVSVLMSAYNEEAVIEEKLQHLLALEYPAEQLKFYIGSDCSDDATNEIVSRYAARHPELHFFPFRERQGKPGVINTLAAQILKSVADPAQHLIVVTDASVMPQPQALKRLARHFKDPAIGLVDGFIQPTGMQQAGISRAENRYISGEALLKHREGKAWGCMMGPFGGFYALRASYFSEVPANFLVDDFYICMRTFEQGGRAISDLEAVSREAVSHEVGEEFRRKSRISAGNFQNLSRFRRLWWPPVGPLRFAFFSHKALRWLGPFFLLLMLLSSALLALVGNLIGQSLFGLMTVGMLLIPLADEGLRRLRIHWLPLRGARYFLAMNLALLSGFFKFVKGVRSNVWQPTKRN